VGLGTGPAFLQITELGVLGTGVLCDTGVQYSRLEDSVSCHTVLGARSTTYH
jgi:hypothetical protein